MADRLRFLPAGDDALLVELGGLEPALALFEGLRDSGMAGIRELVPAARTVLIRFDPLVTSRSELTEAILRIDLSIRTVSKGAIFDIPVTYDSEDLSDVADMLGWTVQDVIRRHTEATFTVAFTGFAPGFAYMTSDDPGFDVPRRKSPRVRIPAGSVAIAGRFGGIYPSDSPGGWQLLGRTPLAMWDLARPRAALLTPGDRVRFCDMARGATVQSQFARSTVTERSEKAEASGLIVTRADRPALYQDLGRSGHADQGVSASGAADRAALRRANRSVGNSPAATAIEVTFGGFAIRTDRAVTIATAGAPCPLEIRTRDDRRLTPPCDRALALDAGDELVLGAPVEGMRTYLALRGGFAVDRSIGSASTDTLARIGPAPIVAGDILVPGSEPVGAVAVESPPLPRLPNAEDIVTIDVLLGPRADWFTDAGVETLLSQEWLATSESSRIGMRLSGPTAIQRLGDAELPSEGAVRGAIQVPHNGQPVVFLSDHPLTGGYPVIGVVSPHQLDLLGQIPIGARIRFRAASPFDPVIMDIDR